MPETLPMASSGPNGAATGPSRDDGRSRVAWNAPRANERGSRIRGPGFTTTTSNDSLHVDDVDDDDDEHALSPVGSSLPRSLLFSPFDTDTDTGDAKASADAAVTAQRPAQEKEGDANFPPSSPSSVTLLDKKTHHPAVISHLLGNQASFADAAVVTPEPEDMTTTYFAAQEPLIETSENPKDPENVGWARSPTDVRRTRCSPCRGLRVLLVLLGHAVLVWVVLGAVRGGRWRGSGKTRGHLGEPNHHDAGGLQWGSTETAPHDHRHFKCNPQHVQSSTAEFEAPGTFEVREALQLHQGRHRPRRGRYYHHVSGHINMIPGAADQGPQLIANTTVWSSWAQTLDRRIATKTTDTTLRLQLVSSGAALPGDDDGDDDGDGDEDEDEQECTFIRLNIAVAPDTSLSTLSVRSTHLSLSLYPDLTPSHLEVTNTTTIRLHRGAVVARSPSSVPPARNTSIDLDSGAIEGVFPLVDLLHLHTQSGAIDASVVPYASSPLNSSSPSSSSSSSSSSAAAAAAAAAIPPAVLDASTQSGALHLMFPAAEGGTVPARRYVTRARTSSGDLSGRFLLGRRTRLQTDVGSLRVEVLPVYSNSSETNEEEKEDGGEVREEEKEEKGDYTHALHTSTKTGASNLRVLDPIFASSSLEPQSQSHTRLSSPSSPPLKLHATHTSRTGFLRAVYPSAWRGSVCAVARVGRAALGGPGLSVTRRERFGWVGSRVCGVKGNGGQEEEEEGERGTGMRGEDGKVDVQLSVQTGNVEFVVSGSGAGQGEGVEDGEL
ncbi:uncharacterized protein IWZ02DRAFT_282453 [Phyllosticta citriasiana]|uniref:uncharacterized protein n=1 Tax=Phyllosticta citriasiana TaxID=595635 RepID=UPI0030FD2716